MKVRIKTLNELIDDNLAEILQFRGNEPVVKFKNKEHIVDGMQKFFGEWITIENDYNQILQGKQILQGGLASYYWRREYIAEFGKSIDEGNETKIEFSSPVNKYCFLFKTSLDESIEDCVEKVRIKHLYGDKVRIYIIAKNTIDNNIGKFIASALKNTFKIYIEFFSNKNNYLFSHEFKSCIIDYYDINLEYKIIGGTQHTEYHIEFEGTFIE
jgi:hypothetical protein